MKNEITAEYVRERLHYDPETGIFTWKNGPKAGQRADRPMNRGRTRRRVRKCAAHRLAWLWMTGSWPQHTIDHIDRDEANNRWDNLRDVTLKEQGLNRNLYRNNRSGVKHVFPLGGRYRATIVDGRVRTIGTFDTVEEAAAAIERKKAEWAAAGYVPVRFQKKRKVEITQELVRRLFDYEEGNLRRKRSDKLVPTLRRKVTINGRPYLLHRIIWLWHYGTLPEWPITIDHINHDYTDHRIENLRLATPSEQGFNQRIRSVNRSGATGVYERADRGSWRAQIKINGVKHDLGTFATKEEAIAARLAAEKEHGIFVHREAA